MEIMKVKLTGISPLILHNNQMVDPLNPYAKEHDKIKNKRNKTEADHEMLGKIEFFASFYLLDGKIVIPQKVLRATFINGAKKDKRGPLAKSGVFFPKPSELIYNGPKTVEELWEAGEPWVFRHPARVQQGTVIRTRPKFDEWKLIVEFEYDPEIIDENAVLVAWEKAGRFVGMCDWRPQFGRFEVRKMRNGRKR